MTTNTLKKYDQCMAISVFYQRKVTGNFIFLLSREFLTIFEISQFCRHRTTRIIIKGVNIVEQEI